MEKLIVELNANQVMVINKALIELPYREAAPLIDFFNEQIKKQSEDGKKMVE